MAKGNRKDNRIEVSIGRQYEIWRAAAQDDSRPILAGVFITRVGKQGYAVAANSFVMAAVPVKLEPPPPKDWPGAVVPARFVQTVAHATRKQEEFVKLTLADDKVSGMTKQGELTVPLIGGQFPDWRTLIPKYTGKAKLGWIGLDPELTFALKRALALQAPRLVFGPAPSAPLLILGEEGVFGVQMPMYCQSPDKERLRLTWKLSTARHQKTPAVKKVGEGGETQPDHPS